MLRGRTAEILPSDPGWVVKLYTNGASELTVRHELRALAMAHELGVPAPKAGALVQRGAYWGYELEFLVGDSGMELLYGGADPIDEARKLAELQLSVHKTIPADFPSVKTTWARKISRASGLNETERAALQELLEEQPEGRRLLHGDFHPGNVMWTARGPMIIDWVDAARGNPAADFARSLVLFDFMVAIDSDPRSKAFLGAYREAVIRRLPGVEEDLEVWLLIARAARLGEGIKVRDEDLRALVRQGLAERA